MEAFSSGREVSRGGLPTPRPYTGLPDNYRGHPLRAYLSGQEENQFQSGLCRPSGRHQRSARGHVAGQLMDYGLGYFDLETRVLEPLENPFGPKVLPMS